MRTFILIAIASAVASTQAHAGNEGGNGGDPVLLRVKLIKEFINSELRSDAISYFKNLNLQQVASGPARNALDDLRSRDVATDILESNYVIKNSCSDVGGQAAGGTMPNKLGGDICLSPGRLAEIDATKAEIVGLAVHEHAHHFGYVDADYEIYKAVYLTVGLANPQWTNPDSRKAYGLGTWSGLPVCFEQNPDGSVTGSPVDAGYCGIKITGYTYLDKFGGIPGYRCFATDGKLSYGYRGPDASCAEASTPIRFNECYVLDKDVASSNVNTIKFTSLPGITSQIHVQYYSYYAQCTNDAGPFPEDKQHTLDCTSNSECSSRVVNYEGQPLPVNTFSFHSDGTAEMNWCTGRYNSDFGGPYYCTQWTSSVLSVKQK